MDQDRNSLDSGYRGGSSHSLNSNSSFGSASTFTNFKESHRDLQLNHPAQSAANEPSSSSYCEPVKSSAASIPSSGGYPCGSFIPYSRQTYNYTEQRRSAFRGTTSPFSYENWKREEKYNKLNKMYKAEKEKIEQNRIMELAGGNRAVGLNYGYTPRSPLSSSMSPNNTAKKRNSELQREKNLQDSYRDPDEGVGYDPNDVIFTSIPAMPYEIYGGTRPSVPVASGMSVGLQNLLNMINRKQAGEDLNHTDQTSKEIPELALNSGTHKASHEASRTALSFPKRVKNVFLKIFKSNPTFPQQKLEDGGAIVHNPVNGHANTPAEHGQPIPLETESKLSDSNNYLKHGRMKKQHTLPSVYVVPDPQKHHQQLPRFTGEHTRPTLPATTGVPLSHIPPSSSSTANAPTRSTSNRIESISGSFHQMNIPGSQIGGVQCSAMVAVAAAYAHVSQVSTWGRQDMDYILRAGDVYYRQAYNAARAVRPARAGGIVRARDETLEPEETLGFINFEPGNGYTTLNISPSIDDAIYGMRDEYHVREDQGTRVSSIGVTLRSAIQTFIASTHNAAMLTSRGSSYGLLRSENHVYYFDSHSCDRSGRSHQNGSSVLVRFPRETAARQLEALINNNIRANTPRRALGEQEAMLDYQFSLFPIIMLSSPIPSVSILASTPPFARAAAVPSSSNPPSHPSPISKPSRITNATSARYRRGKTYPIAEEQTGIGLISPVPLSSAAGISTDTQTHSPLAEARETIMDTTPTASGTAAICSVGMFVGKCESKNNAFKLITTDMSNTIHGRVEAAVRRKLDPLVNICDKHYLCFTGNYKKNQKHTGCSNPFQKANHVRKKGLRVVTQNHLSFNIPFLCTDMFLCPPCYHDIKNCLNDQTLNPANESRSTVSMDRVAIEGEAVIDNDGVHATPQSQTPNAVADSSPVTPTRTYSVPNPSTVLASPYSKISRALRSLNSIPPPRKDVRSTKGLQRTYNEAITAMRRLFHSYAKFETPKTSKPIPEKTPRIRTNIVQNLAERFKLQTTKKDRYQILTTVPVEMTVKETVDTFGITKYMAKKARSLYGEKGPYSAPAERPKRTLAKDLTDRVRLFFLDPSNSRPRPGLRDTIYIKQDNGVRTPVAVQDVVMTAQELYHSFPLEANEKISLTSFIGLKPKQCRWTGSKGHHNSCTCIIHANFYFLMDALGKTGKAEEILQEFSCGLNNPDCMLGFCNSCPTNEAVDPVIEPFEDDDTIRFRYWRAGQRCVLEDLVEEVHEFRQRVAAYIPEMKKHYFIYKKQQNYIKTLQLDLINQPGSVMVHLDFSENYAFLIQDSVQSYRWTNDQATIHPFYASWYREGNLVNKAYVVISDHLNHDTDAVACFIEALIANLKDDVEGLQKVYYVSDGCGGQYKNFKNFINLLYHERDHGVPAEWIFTATAHGKNRCDAIGAITKRSAKVAVLRSAETIIRTASEMFVFCAAKLSSNKLTYLFVSSKSVQDYSERIDLANRYTQGRTIPGTRSYHSYAPLNNNTLRMRIFSDSAEYRDHNLIPEVDDMDVDEPDVVTNYRIGQYVIVDMGRRSLQLGLIVGVDMQEEDYEIRFMKKGNQDNSFAWSDQDIIHVVDRSQIRDEVMAPTTQTGRIYKLTDVDWNRIHN